VTGHRAVSESDLCDAATWATIRSAGASVLGRWVCLKNPIIQYERRPFLRLQTISDSALPTDSGLI